MAAAGSAREQLRHQEPSLGASTGRLGCWLPFLPAQIRSPDAIRWPASPGHAERHSTSALFKDKASPSVPPSGSLFVLSSELHLNRFPNSSHSLRTVFRSISSPRRSLCLRRHIISRRHLSTTRIYDSQDNLSDRPHDPIKPSLSTNINQGDQHSIVEQKEL
jgi:hypothetical protein